MQQRKLQQSKFLQLSLKKRPNKLKSLKVAKSKDDDGGVVDGSVDAGDE